MWKRSHSSLHWKRGFGLTSFKKSWGILHSVSLGRVCELAVGYHGRFVSSRGLERVFKIL